MSKNNAHEQPVTQSPERLQQIHNRMNLLRGSRDFLLASLKNGYGVDVLTHTPQLQIANNVHKINDLTNIVDQSSPVAATHQTIAPTFEASQAMSLMLNNNIASVSPEIDNSYSEIIDPTRSSTTNTAQQSTNVTNITAANINNNLSTGPKDNDVDQIRNQIDQIFNEAA